MSKSQRYPFLDTLRGVAIILVMVSHFRHFPGCPDWFQWFATRGFVGVDIFFVLSGWLVGGQLLRIYREQGKISVLNFWLRRWLRTLPAYYAALVVVTIIGFVKPHHFWEFVFFVQNYFHPEDWALTWSLCIEEHFYLFLPLLLLLLINARRIGKWSVVVLALFFIMLSPILRYVMLPEILRHDYTWFFSKVYGVTHFRLDGLFIGVAFAAMREWKMVIWKKMEIYALPLGIGGFLLILISNWGPTFSGNSIQGGVPLTGYSVVFLLCLVYLGVALLIVLGTSEKFYDQLRVPGSRWLADHAYALYLTHELSIWTLKNWIPKTFQWEPLQIHFGLSLVLAFLLSCVFSIILRNAVELPGLRLRARFAPLDRTA